MTLRMWGAGLLAASCAVASVPAAAGPLLIQPTTVQFAPARHSAAIEVTNASSDPATLQFRAFRWSQAEGRDRLDPTADLVVSPPIVVVPPHGTQVFRVLDRASAPGGGERSYRLKLSELPTPAGSTAIAIHVEFSLPVFITPAAASPRLHAGIADGALRIVNDGDRRLRLSTIAFKDAGGRQVGLPGAANTYLLAGTSRREPLPAGLSAAATLRLTATTDSGPIDVPVDRLASR